MPTLISNYLSVAKNPNGFEPVPYSNLLNEAQNIKLNIQPGKTYFVRIVSMAAFSASWLHFDQHEMTIIEIDGVYTKKKTVDSIYVTAAQRYGVLIKAKPTASRNYAFISSFDVSMFNKPFIQNPQLNPNVTGYLVYNSYAPLPHELSVAGFNTVDDFTLTPLDGEPLLENPDKIITIDFKFATQFGQNRYDMSYSLALWLSLTIP